MARSIGRWASFLGLLGAGIILTPSLPFSLGIHGHFSLVGPLLVIVSGLIFMRSGLGLGIGIGDWQLSWIRLTATGYLVIGLGLTLSSLVNFAVYNQIMSPDRLVILICGFGALWFGGKWFQKNGHNGVS